MSPHVAGVLRAYAQVLFSGSPLVGALMLAATMVRPTVGLVGLLGTIAAQALSSALGLDKDTVARGGFAYNVLLLSLVLGASWAPGVPLLLLGAVLVPVALLLHVAVAAFLGHHLRLPALSLPFVLSAWLASAAAPFVRGLAAAAASSPTGVDQTLPDLVAAPLRALGAILAVPDAAAGAVVLAALVVHSRIALVCAAVGWAAATAAGSYLLAFPPGQFETTLGFNLVLTSVALGGVYYLPGWRSLTLAAAGTVASGVIGVASASMLMALSLPVGALPFNATVLLVLYALGTGARGVGPIAVGVPGSTPEETLHRHRTRTERFGDALALRLPFAGTWVCAQGNDGAHTHQGPWRHGLDFEIADDAGRTFSGDGSTLTEFYCYGAAVLAPAAGTVVAVRDGLPDQTPGTSNLEQPWGNCVVLRIDETRYVALAHLMPGTIRVVPGMNVYLGQEIGRVGSSGRSPVPHLHVQLQATPEIGAPTSPICFRDGVIEGDDGAVVVPTLIPSEGKRVRNLWVDAEIGAALSLPAGGRWRFSVTSGGEARPVVLSSGIDLLGRRILSEEGTPHRLTYEATGWLFTVDEVDAPPGTLLWAIGLALSRVPYDGADRLGWRDVAAGARGGRTAVDWLRDAIAWLLPDDPLRLVFRQIRRYRGVEVLGGGEGVETFARLDAEAGLRELRVSAQGRSLDAVLLEGP